MSCPPDEPTLRIGAIIMGKLRPSNTNQEIDRKEINQTL